MLTKMPIERISKGVRRLPDEWWEYREERRRTRRRRIKLLHKRRLHNA